jgi:hypothetical protein
MRKTMMLAAMMLAAGAVLVPGAASAGCYRMGLSGYHHYRSCIGPHFMYPHHRVCRHHHCWYR